MSLQPGLLDVKKARFDDLVDEAFDLGSGEGKFVEIAIRWEESEIAQDVLLAVTDGYYDGKDDLQFDSQSYSLEFSEDDIADVQFGFDQLPVGTGLTRATALRYYVEFDAFLNPDHLGVGGKWTWGGGRGSSTKRTPLEFCERWGITLHAET
ncbi:hypothetical protein J7443_19580 [Tropicibacter sp. R15_0]|uniref:hypothetical protein n=1 Tax=Tropicibacter sp. R15_0 TaxID=2821101 RepID=UPI001ADCCA65|nr:hypothetical protein [Tropicibacter sp. R15_0]MBO9467450.1 hypothetical protein [Tropicibacter sp. R15_0]